MNKAILIGNLTKKPEKAMTQSGKEVSRFTLAVGNEKVEYLDCVAWDKLASICNTYLDKGKKVMVEGEIQQRRWDDNTGRTHYSWNVVVRNMEMLSPREKATSEDTYAPLEKELPKQSELEEYSYKQAMEDDDIPF